MSHISRISHISLTSNILTSIGNRNSLEIFMRKNYFSPISKVVYVDLVFRLAWMLQAGRQAVLPPRSEARGPNQSVIW